MVWGFDKQKKKDSGASGNNTALAEQDPSTKVRSISAATETTSTAVKSEFNFNKNTNVVTYQTTNETVTHQRRATVVEKITCRAPTREELAEFGVQANSRTNGSKATTTTTTQIVSRTPHSTFSPDIVGSATLVQSQSATTAQRTETRYSVNRAGDRVGTGAIPKSPLQIAKYDGSEKYISYRGSNVGTGQRTVFPNSSLSSLKSPAAMPARSGSLRATGLFSNEKPQIAKYSGNAAYESPMLAKTSAPSKTYGSDAKAYTVIEVPPKVAQIQAAPNLKLKPAIVHIFNHESFQREDLHRVGSTADVTALKTVFKAFKCTVDVTTNATVAMVKKKMSELASYDFRTHSALVIVVLSHGDRHDMIFGWDAPYSLHESIVLPIVHNKTLREKPKIFFIQACKGNMRPGDYIMDAFTTSGTPSQILKCYSTFEGYVACRRYDGTPFILSLCEALTKWGHNLPINEIMEKVRTAVRQLTNDKQVPSVESTMDIKYVFGDYV